jgi:p-hydroxybenzoate 3-monooxygenase
LLLSHLLHLEGIGSLVVEQRSRHRVEQRVRAGVLEQGTADLLIAAGVGDRMLRQGMIHRGIELRFAGEGHRIDFAELTGGRCITVYGQQEVVKDLIEARLKTGGQIFFAAEGVSIGGFEPSGRPAIAFQQAGEPVEINCEFIAGCDGSHGVCRPSIPAGALRIYERAYPFAWLGILAEAPPASEELIYAHHERGFALASMRSPTLSRLYLQCAPDEDLNQWPDSRIWQELQARLQTRVRFRLTEGPIIQRGITTMRSFVAEPMQFGRLFLAGDSAHIVPPTGAKGMNLAVADVKLLAQALSRYYADGDEQPLAAYSPGCLRRVWRAQHFSWWMTSMLHRLDDDSGFHYRRQLAELENVTSSRAAAQNLAENYTGEIR